MLFHCFLWNNNALFKSNEGIEGNRVPTNPHLYFLWKKLSFILLQVQPFQSLITTLKDSSKDSSGFTVLYAVFNSYRSVTVRDHPKDKYLIALVHELNEFVNSELLQVSVYPMDSC